MKSLSLEGEGVVLHLEYDETDSSGMVALTYCLARLLRDDFSQRWAREIATRLVRSIIAKLVKDDKKFLKANGNYKVKEGSEHETD